MKKIDNEFIIKKLIGKKAIGLTENEIRTIVNKSNNNKNKFYIYSVFHYKILYSVFKQGMEKYKENIEKIAYIKCLKHNYTKLDNIDDLDIIIDILILALNGSYLGNVLFVTEKNTMLSLIILSVLFLLIALKTFVKIHQRYSFYIEILNDIEKELI